MFALLLVAATGAWAQTTVNGLFTVNADGDQVQFASGNLRYTSGAWSFFDHQYDYYAEYSDDSWDKFGWSTSGTTYGRSTSMTENLYKGDFVDWGNAVGTGWRTLSNDEWVYVVNTRSGSTIGTTANARFAKAKVNDVQGLILFPDTYTHPDGVTAPTGVNATGSTGWNGNNYTAADWTKMESAGCVFLPAAGGRYNQSNPTLVVNAGNEGNYWSSTSNNSTANLLTFSGNSFSPSITDSPRMGYSVRLVKSAPTYSITLAEGTEDEGNWNVPTKAAEGAKVTATYKGEKKVKSVKAVKKAPSATDLATITADYEAKDGETLTGTLASNVKISIAAGATVTLKDVNITNLGVGYDWAGITCESDATLVLEGTNTVCAGRGSDGYNNYPGIYIAPDKTLTIQGDGTLTAYSNDSQPYGAGIGGGYKIACGNIVINSGTITATGGWNAAGIGGGNSASCGNITINGGTVTATGGNYGAGIGSGAAGENQGSCGNITISGGTVTATGGENAAGIGGGSTNGVCGTITITKGVTSVKATKGANTPNSIGAGDGGQDITVNIENGANVTQK